MLNKAEEKALLAEVIAGLPQGYVKDILADMRPEIDNAITSDFGFVPFAQRRREAEAHRVEMLESQKQREAIKAEIRDLERKRAILSAGLDELRSTIRQFSKL